MGVWSEPLTAWPRGLRFPPQRVSELTRTQLEHCVSFEWEDNECKGECDASLDEVMASVCDTAKLFGYFTKQERAAWKELLSVVVDANGAHPMVKQHGVALYFYCSDRDCVFALFYDQRFPSALFQRRSTVDAERLHEPEDAVASWKAAGLWQEPTAEESRKVGCEGGCARLHSPNDCVTKRRLVPLKVPCGCV